MVSIKMRRIAGCQSQSVVTPPFHVSAGRPQGSDGNLLIPSCLMANLLKGTAEGLLNLKDLLSVLPASDRTNLFGLRRAAKGDKAYLLILK